MFDYYEDKSVEVMAAMTKNIGLLTENLKVAIESLAQQSDNVKRLLKVIEIKDAAHKELLDNYIAGANSGDWGNWDPEKEPMVIESRRVLNYPKE